MASFLGDDPSKDLTRDADALTRQNTPYAGFNLLLLEPLAPPSAPTADADTLAYDARLVSNGGGGGGPISSRALTDAERACGGVSNGVDGRGGDQWPKVVQGRDELGNVLAELSRGPEMDERLAGRLIELLTCVLASGLVPRGGGRRGSIAHYLTCFFSPPGFEKDFFFFFYVLLYHALG